MRGEALKGVYIHMVCAFVGPGKRGQMAGEGDMPMFTLSNTHIEKVNLNKQTNS